MSNIYEYDGYPRELEKENQELKTHKEHMEKACKELQAERDAFVKKAKKAFTQIKKEEARLAKGGKPMSKSWHIAHNELREEF